MKRMMPIFVSHYTVNSPYEEVVRKLVISLEKFGLAYDIEGTETLGSWRLNSNYCATQVQKMLKKHHPKSILRLDADAIIQRTPSLFTSEKFDADIAAVIWDKSRLRPEGELLGGTLFFANNDRVQFIVDRWVGLCSRELRIRNPDALKLILDKNRGKVNFQKLPEEYCKIFDLMRYVKEPVIEHFQASRKFRRLMNRAI